MGQTFSIDLVVHAQRYLELLAIVGEHPELVTAGPALQHAIKRYAVFMETDAHYEYFQDPRPLPADIAWIWCVHCLNPETYHQDCKNAFGKLVPYYSSGERKTFSDPFSQEDRFASVPLNSKFSPSLNLEAAVIRQQNFLRDSVPFLGANRKQLKKLKRSYEMFFRLIQYHGKHQTLVPTLGIDLMWHSHMMVPEAYSRDCHKILHFLLNHDDSIPAPTLNECLQKTENLWKSQYGEDFLGNKIKRQKTISIVIEEDENEDSEHTDQPTLTGLPLCGTIYSDFEIGDDF